MKCEGARELFSAYHENDIDYALMALLRTHMDECASCRHEHELFVKTWKSVEALPDIEPPVDFRHDVIMRVARLQHEKAQVDKRPFWAFGMRSLFSKGMSARLAATAAIILIALALMIYGNTAVDVVKSVVAPVQIIPDSGKISESRSSADGVTALDTSIKNLWQSRQLGRNSLWITVEPKRNIDGRIVYKVLLSINKASFRGNDVSNRIGAQVYLLQPGTGGKPDRQIDETLWMGSVLGDRPVLLTLDVDRSQGQAGAVNLMVVWTHREREFAQIIYLPPDGRGSYSGDIYSNGWNTSSTVESGNDIYASLQSISQRYGVVIVANATLDTKVTVPVVGDGDLEWMLRSTLNPVKLDWMMADRAVYVDRQYPFMTTR